MSTERDVNRIVRSWMEEGVTALPDQVLDAVLDQVPATPQRRSAWSAWRDPFMNKFVAFGLGAAAVIVALLIGAQLVGPPNVIGPPADSPSPTPAPSATLTAGGALDPGTRYGLTRENVSLSFAVPTSGWTYDGFNVSGHSGSPQDSYLWFYTSMSGPGYTTPAVFPDPCTHEGAIEFEDSLAGETEAWASVPRTEVMSAPTDLTVDGRAAKSVVVVVPEDVGCPYDEFWLLYDPRCGAILDCTTYPSWLGETLRIWIVDLGDGSRFSIRAEVRYPDAGPELQQELQQIVDSIQFE